MLGPGWQQHRRGRSGIRAGDRVVGNPARARASRSELRSHAARHFVQSAAGGGPGCGGAGRSGAAGTVRLHRRCASTRRRRDSHAAERRKRSVIPRDAIAAGLVLVPANRLEALLQQRSIRENVALPAFRKIGRWGGIHIRREGERVAAAVKRLQIDTRAESELRRLSGGNQQKVVIARWLAAGFESLLCFDPTRGIDIGTKYQIYGLIRELAAHGSAVLLFTSELPEIPWCAIVPSCCSAGASSMSCPRARRTKRRFCARRTGWRRTPNIA